MGDMVMSGPSDDDDDFGAKMMEMLPLTCRMQMGECGQGLYEACLEGTENMSCSDCSATFVEKGGREMAMSGLSGDEFIDKIMEMLPNTCMWKMEECQLTWLFSEACVSEGRIGRQHCKSCVDKFAARGGCPLLNKGKDVDHLIPGGCHLCEMPATKYCRNHGGSSKKPSKGRQTKRKGKSGKTMKPKSGKRKSGKQSTGRTRRGKKSSKQGKKLRR